MLRIVDYAKRKDISGTKEKTTNHYKLSAVNQKNLGNLELN